MYQDGTSLEVICALCGHDSVKTTEIYVERHLRTVVKPNEGVVKPSKPKEVSAAEVLEKALSDFG